tara:strand:- start:489 stop:797 length:309 start_codon:yes stop_codon:yes gene_type:complete
MLRFFGPKRIGGYYNKPVTNLKKSKTIGGKIFTRKSVHQRKIPHPNAKEAAKLSSKGFLTATEAQERYQKSGYKTRIIKQKDWDGEINKSSYTPVWSVFVRR